jgi:hypothetical protein
MSSSGELETVMNGDVRQASPGAPKSLARSAAQLEDAKAMCGRSTKAVDEAIFGQTPSQVRSDRRSTSFRKLPLRFGAVRRDGLGTGLPSTCRKASAPVRHPFHDGRVHIRSEASHNLERSSDAFAPRLDGRGRSAFGVIAAAAA